MVSTRLPVHTEPFPQSPGAQRYKAAGQADQYGAHKHWQISSMVSKGVNTTVTAQYSRNMYKG